MKVVAFTFAAGQEMSEHTARHDVLIQAVAGEFDLAMAGDTVRLVPGTLLHLNAMLPHSVTTVTGGVLTVTMLLGHPG